MDEYTNYLAHHGVKGQQWGVRRYQNPDGSLTPEGKEKLNKYKQRQAKPYYRNRERTKRSKEKLNNSNLRYKNPAKWRKKMQKKGKKIVDYDVYIKGISNMSFDDMRFEKRARRGEIAAQAALGLIGRTAVAIPLELRIQKERYERGSRA